MRGKRILNNACGMDDGITPAGAGKTDSLHLRNSRLQDHPRRCGENTALACFGSFFAGSPPQVRGKRLFSKPFEAEAGITPAGAGKTLSRFA